MSMMLRVAGWLLFGMGAGYCGLQIMEGHINWKSPLTMIAAIAMPLGMAMTGLSTLVSWFERRAHGARSLGNREPDPEPAEARPADPSQPEKHYAARPLKIEKKLPGAIDKYTQGVKGEEKSPPA